MFVLSSRLSCAALLTAAMGLAVGCDADKATKNAGAQKPASGDDSKAAETKAAETKAAESNPEEPEPAGSGEAELQGACHFKNGEQCFEVFSKFQPRVEGTKTACEGPGEWKVEPCPKEDLIARCEKEDETNFYYKAAEKNLDGAKAGCEAFHGKFIDMPEGT